MNLLFITSIITSVLAAPLAVSALGPSFTSIQNVDNSGGFGPYNTPFFNTQAGPGPFFAPWNQPFSTGPVGFNAGSGFGGPGGFGMGAGFGGPGGIGIGAGF